MLMASMEVEMPSRTTICAMCRLPGIACGGEVSANRTAGATCAAVGTGGSSSRSSAGVMFSHLRTADSISHLLGAAHSRGSRHGRPRPQRDLNLSRSVGRANVASARHSIQQCRVQPVGVEGDLGPHQLTGWAGEPLDPRR